MSIDLMELAKTALGSNALKMIAGKLGESEKNTSSAVELAGSTILGSLIKKASTPSGANALLRDVKGFDAGMLGNLTEMFTGKADGDNSSAWNQLGSDLIGNLLGEKQSGLIKTIGRLAGIGEGSSKSLLTMLAPLFMGLIAKQFRSGNLSLEGLVDLIMGQKATVAQSLPPQLSQELGVASLLDQGSDVVHRAQAPAKPPVDPVRPLVKVLVPLALLIAVGYIGWYFFLKPDTNVAKNDTGVVGSAENPRSDRVTVNKPVIPGFNLDTHSADLTQSFGSLTESISGISDEASARAVLPKIAELEKQFAGFGLDKLAAGPTAQLRELVRPMVEKLETALKTAYAIPGVQSILEPAMESLMKTVSGLVKSD